MWSRPTNHGGRDGQPGTVRHEEGASCGKEQTSVLGGMVYHKKNCTIGG